MQTKEVQEKIGSALPASMEKPPNIMLLFEDLEVIPFADETLIALKQSDQPT